MSKSNLLKLLINSLIGAILVVIWLKLVNLELVVEELKKVKLDYLGFFFGFIVLSTVLRSTRLKILLKSYKIALSEVIKLNFISQLLSFVIPIRAGEIAKSVYLNNQYQISFGKVIIWILLDRFLDFWSVLLLICLLFPLVQVNLPTQFLVTIFMAFLVMTSVAVSIIIAPVRTKKLFDYFKVFLAFKRLQKIYLNINANIFDGFIIFRNNFSDLPKLILLSILALISDALSWFIVLSAFNIQLPYLKLFFGSLISMLTFLIPAAPGYVGSAEGSGLLVFSGILGLEPNLASSAVLVSHLLVIIALPIFGIVSLYLLKFNLKLVWKKLRKE